MLRKVALIFLILTGFWYGAGLLNMPFALIVLTAIIFYSFLYAVGAGIVWRILPKERRVSLKRHWVRFHLTVLVYLVLLILGCRMISRHYMLSMPGPVQTALKILLLFYTIFIIRNCLRKGHMKTTVLGTIAYVVFIILPVFGSLVSFSSEGISRSNYDALSSLGYLNWVPAGKDTSERSVTKYDPNISYEGLNLYTSKSDGKAFLLDMEGNIVHTWILSTDPKFKWLHAEMLPNGDLISCCGTGQKLSRIDWNSRTIWDLYIPVHHDMFIAENGDIYALAQEDTVEFFAGIPVPIIIDYVMVVSAEGVIKKRIDYASLVKKHVKPRVLFSSYKVITKPRILKAMLLRKINGSHPMPPRLMQDHFHSNSIQVVDREIKGLCKQGDILLSMRGIDLVTILDPTAEELVWEWGPGIVEMQHHATLLENGRIMLLDNGSRRGYSTVIELDPLTGAILWEYRADKKEDFFTNNQGGCQRLPNGNTLITESNKGHVFEVTPDGSMVWEFFTPRHTEDKSKRKGLYRMTRITNPLGNIKPDGDFPDTLGATKSNDK